MATHDFDIGVIGGGAAGLTVASGAAQLGARTLLVEMREALGGDCLHFGCVPSKTLIRSAQVFHLMHSGPKFGLPEAAPGPVDFSKVRDRIREVISTIQHHDSVERFCSLGVQVKFGLAEFVDEHAIRLHGRTISANKWVVATGARPSIPPVPGLDEVDFLTNETIFSMDSLPEDMLVLGGGAIAVEMAQAFQRLGCRITLIQRSGQILSSEDEDMAEGVRRALEEAGVRVAVSMSAKGVRRTSRGVEVIAEDPEGVEHEFGAGTLFVALGRRPNTDTLALDNAGVDHSAKGVSVDGRMRTNQSHIFACGDVTGKHQFTHAAGYEGGLVVSNALIHFPRKANYDWMPRAVYTEPEFAALGKTERQCREEGIDYEVWTTDFKDNDRALAEGEENGRLKLLLDSRERVLGVQILGPSAGELLGEWSAVVAGSVKLSTLASAVHAYPTLAEINKRVAGDVMAPKIFSGLVQKGVKFLFNYKGRACEWTGTGDGGREA